MDYFRVFMKKTFSSEKIGLGMQLGMRLGAQNFTCKNEMC